MPLFFIKISKMRVGQGLGTRLPPQINLRPWTGWTVLSLFCVFQFLLQGSIGVLAAGIKESFHVDATEVSILSSAFFYSYIFMQIPVGVIYDRLGIRRVASAAILLMAASCALLAMAPSFQWAVYSRILMGFGCSFGFVGLLTGIKSWFPAERFPFVIALGECAAMGGVALANTLLSKQVAVFGWQAAMLALAGIAALLAWIVWWKIPSGGPVAPVADEAAALAVETWEEAQGFGKQLRRLARTREVWLGGLFAGCTFAVVSVFVSLWGVPYICAAYGVDVVLAASMVSTVYVGIAVSSPLVGWLASWVNYASLMVIGSALSFFCMALILVGPTVSFGFLYGLMFVLGFASSVYQLPFALVSRRVPQRVQGAAMGTTNMITMLSAPLLQPLVGMILSLVGARTAGGMEVYTRADYQLALIILPVCQIVAFVVAFALNDRTAPGVAEHVKRMATARFRSAKPAA